MKPEFLMPEPKYIKMLANSFFKTTGMTIGMKEGNHVSATISKVTGATMTDIVIPCSIRLYPSRLAPGELLQWAEHPEGYGLVIGARGIDIFASTDSGYLYAAMTIKQLQAEFRSEIPGMSIGDAPDMKRRGTMLTFAQGHTEYRETYMEHLIPRLAEWKINELYVYLETYFQFPSFPSLGGKGAMTPADVRKLEKLCQEYGIKLIPQLNVLGHCGLLLSLQKYHHLGEYEPDVDFRTERAENLCACSPEAWDLTRTILSDIINCFDSEVIHVGGDEVSRLGVCSRCLSTPTQRGKLGIYLDYFQKIQTLLLSKDRKMGIWGDMLLHHMKDCVEGPVEAFMHMAKTTIIYDWNYTGGSEESLRLFVENGFETVACSSTHLVYTTAMWPAQRWHIQNLFKDAQVVGVQGGMVSAWCNYAGLHEEQFHFLHAIGGALLWSGTWGRLDERLSSANNEQVYQAYLLHRHGFHTNTLAEYWHIVGDANGPILKPLLPNNGSNPRRCLFYTDNVLMFWMHYSKALEGVNLEQYKHGISQAAELWEQVEHDKGGRQDPYLSIQKGPLLIHEHLLQRFLMSEKLYEKYDLAGKHQYDHPESYKLSLQEAAEVLLRHIADFPPIESYLESMHHLVGTENSSMLRLEATKRNMAQLAEFIMYLAHSQRPLPAFYELHDMFLGMPRTNWCYDREHEWMDAPQRFQRYAVQVDPWDSFNIIGGIHENG